jgi:hypothetical protein
LAGSFRIAMSTKLIAYADDAIRLAVHRAVALETSPGVAHCEGEAVPQHRRRHRARGRRSKGQHDAVPQPGSPGSPTGRPIAARSDANSAGRTEGDTAANPLDR